MKKWLKYFQVFYTNKVYVLVLALTAACAYGFKVIHPTIGIDDTPYAYYFEEGLVAIVGRWVLFLLNKVVSIAEYAPFLTDFVAVLLLMLAVTVWGALLYSIFENKGVSQIPFLSYIFFGAIFLSCPLISEVFTYYLHNGIAIGYLASGISLCFFREGLLRMEEQKGKKILPELPALKSFAGTVLGLWIAIGCYESFMIVWLLGIFLVLLSERFAGIRRNVFHALCLAAAVAVVGIILRSVMIVLVTKIFGLEYLQDEAVQRSIMEMAAWIFEPGAFSEFAMVLKRIYVMYGVFGLAYYPIKIFVLASGVIVLLSVWRTLKNKDIWTLLLMIGSFVASFILVMIEGKATLYRSAQFVPVICGYGIFLFCYICRGYLGNQENGAKEADSAKEVQLQNAKKDISSRFKGVIGAMVLVLLCSILWNQCTDMNKWFYIDYMKYEYAKQTIKSIAYELEENYDTSKPVVFTGTYEVPQGIIGDAYVPYNSEVYFKMLNATSWLDEDLLDKFNRGYGVWVAQTPSLSVIDWGRYAFDTNEELIKFFEMHGYDLKPLLGMDYAEAEEYSLTLPHYPQEGSIVDRGEYIIVHF